MSNDTNTAGIVCECGSETRVIRTTPAHGYTTRRRECPSCGKRLTTVERPIQDAPPSATAISDGLLATSIGQIAESVRQLQLLSGITPADPHDAT
jgi:transcriptional regulator NrdR family protein